MLTRTYVASLESSWEDFTKDEATIVSPPPTICTLPHSSMLLTEMCRRTAPTDLLYRVAKQMSIFVNNPFSITGLGT
jgi:hypothetical protein